MKWIGALLLLMSSYFCGIYLAKREGAELKTIDSLISLLGYMRRRMQGERIPLYDVFAGYEDEYLESVGFLPNLRSCRNGLNSIWRNSLVVLPVSEGIFRELDIFGASMGRLSFDEQLGCLDICITALEEEKKKLRSELPKKQKSIKTVALLLGALTAILLL